LGTYAIESIRDRLRSVIEEIEDWKYLSFPGKDEDVLGVGGKPNEGEEKGKAEIEVKNEGGG
jgi:hypothetical protein